MVTRLKNGIQKPKNVVYTQAFFVPNVVPSSFTEASKYPKWMDSMKEDYDAFIQNGTQELVPFEVDMKVIGNRWIYRIKRKPTSEFDRLESRVVAKGYHQEKAIDFFETFNPIVKHETIRLAVVMDLSKNQVIRQLEVNNTYLNGNLDEVVYMNKPQEFEVQS